MNVDAAVGLPAILSRGGLLDRCGHLVLSEQMSRHGRVRGRGCRKPRTGYAQRASIGHAVPDGERIATGRRRFDRFFRRSFKRSAATVFF